MLAKYLWIAGSAIFLVLGFLHLYYTFFSTRFHARNRNVTEEMKQTSPVLTKETTMWKAWVGFNASHSIGAIFFGLMNILMASQFGQVLQNPLYIFLVLSVSAFYLFLAKCYWFSIPRAGILIATACFAISSLLLFF